MLDKHKRKRYNNTVVCKRHAFIGRSEGREIRTWQKSELKRMKLLTARFVALSVSARDPVFRPSFARENATKSPA